MPNLELLYRETDSIRPEERPSTSTRTVSECDGTR